MRLYTSSRLSLIFLTATYEKLHSWFPSYLCKWEGQVGGRQKIMPHYKSYTRLRVKPQNKIDAVGSEIEARASIAWHLVTSANLSRAAWGDFQKNGTQLHIRHYELGILLYPDLWEVRVCDKALCIYTWLTRRYIQIGAGNTHVGCELWKPKAKTPRFRLGQQR